MDVSVSKCESPTGCIIEFLLNSPFRTHTFENKKEIVSVGRPIPVLTLNQTTKVKSKQTARHFQMSYYEKYTWLCGCKKNNKMYCWPCLLFGNEKNVWVKEGYENLNNFFNASSKHEKSQSHITALLTLKLFGKERINLAVDNQNKIDIINHNKKVTDNRYILRRYIDVVCFLSLQELSFRSHNENITSVNRGNDMELLKLIALYDNALAKHLEESSLFSSNRIQNDLIECIASSILISIQKEIDESKFVAILLDETSDVSTRSQLSTILRYVTVNGKIQERFLGFTDVSEDRSATALAKHVIETIKKLNCEKKLIAQSYDGAAVISSELNETHAKVKETYPKALFIHSCAHILNLVLSQSVNYIKECNIFFSTITGISSFFSHSTKRVHSWEDFMKVKFPKMAPTSWTYNSRIVSTVFNHRSVLVDFFKNIVDHPDSWDKATIVLSSGFIHFLNDSTCIFLLSVFDEIFSHTDVLYSILQNKCFEVSHCINQIEETKNKIEKLIKNFDKYYDYTKSLTVFFNRKRKAEEEQELVLHLRTIFYEIIDTIILQISSRFEKINCLSFIELLNNKNFNNFDTNFPNSLLNSLKENYGDYFDMTLLGNELRVLYSSRQFENMDILDLFEYMKTNDLESALSEIFKLICLILSLPCTTVTIEKTLSTLKRIRTYARNTTNENRVSFLAIISVEKELLEELRSRNDFYDIVIEQFSRKNKEIELILK